MSRDLDIDLKDEIVKPRLQPIFMAVFSFDSGTVRFWNGVGPLVYEGETFTGAGNLLSASEVSETESTEAQGMTFTLSGIPESIVQIALAENYTNRSCQLFFACLDSDGEFVGEPYQLFSGLMDVMTIDGPIENAVINVSAENRLIELKKAKVSRYTPEDQKRTFPDDKGFDFVPALQDKEIVWGKKSA